MLGDRACNACEWPFCERVSDRISLGKGVGEKSRNTSKYARRVRSSDPLHSPTLSGRASIPTSPESARTHERFTRQSRAHFRPQHTNLKCKSPHLTVPMRMTVSMPTAAAAASAMRVTVMASRRDHADQVDRESDGTDSQELSRVHLWRVDKALNRLEDDKDGNEAEEDAVGKAGQRLDARVTGNGMILSQFRKERMRESRVIRLARRYKRCCSAKSP